MSCTAGFLLCVGVFTENKTVVLTSVYYIFSHERPNTSILGTTTQRRRRGMRDTHARHRMSRMGVSHTYSLWPARQIAMKVCGK
jgi:hypothetical protein